MNIRPLEASDIPAVAALHHKTLRHRSGLPPEGLISAFRRVFLDGPVCASDLPSLVMDADGEVVGFQGVQVREFEFEGQVRRLSSIGPVFVAARYRALAAGAQLIKAAMHAGQDLTISDAASLEAARIWERLGGKTALPQTVEWCVPLAPARLAVAGMLRGRSRISRLLGYGARPFAGIVDRARRARRPSMRRAQRGSRGEAEPLAVSRYEELVRTFEPGAALRMLCPPHIAEWIFAELDRYRDRGELVAREIKDDRRTYGWFIGHAWPDQVFRVMQVRANPRDMPLVLGSLMDEAERLGMAAVCGRIDGDIAKPLAALGARLDYGPWMLVHARDQRIEDAILSMQSDLSMLDGERLMYIRGQTYP
jgi:hypothetical protein